MSYRLINANILAEKYSEVNNMPCIYANLPNGLDGKGYDVIEWDKQEPKTKWISVSEKLPEEYICDDGYIEPSDYVLVWGDHGNYGISRYWGNRRSKSESPNTYKDWMDLDWVAQKPIAWMPLPEPYSAEVESE